MQSITADEDASLIRVTFSSLISSDDTESFLTHFLFVCVLMQSINTEDDVSYGAPSSLISSDEDEDRKFQVTSWKVPGFSPKHTQVCH